MTSCRPTKLASDERPAEAVANEQIRRIVDRHHPIIRFSGFDGEVSSCFLASGQHVQHTLDGGITANWRAAKGESRHSRRFGLSVTSNESASEPTDASSGAKNSAEVSRIISPSLILVPPLSHFVYINAKNQP